MNQPRRNLPIRRAGVSFATALAGALAVGGVLPAALAADFSQGDTRASLDTTVTHGMAFRIGQRKDSLTGVNSDDGDRNYARGVISNTAKITSELDVDWRGRLGAFVRVQGFADFENRNRDRKHVALSREALDEVGDGFEVLDYYVAGAFDAGSVPVDFRLGSHVLNWGESTFIQNGINVINPFDVAKLRKPGAELRDGLLPVPMISASIAPFDALSLEGFYQLAWKETEVDPSGTYFSSNDYAAPGGRMGFLSRSDVPVSDKGGGLPVPPALLGAINADFAASGVMDCRIASPAPTFAGSDCEPERSPDFLGVARSPDRDPRDSGQYGIAMRILAENLDDTEFGFYFINHHSRLPLVSARYGTPDGYGSGLSAAGSVRAENSRTFQAVSGAVRQQAAMQIREGVVAQVPPGTPQPVIEQLVEAQLAAPETRLQLEETVRGRISGIAQLLAIDRYAGTARYFVEYPEDLKVFGFSFNTQLGSTGWALQGEYSFHLDSPLQLAEDHLFTQGLLPLAAALRSDPRAPALRGLLGGKLQGWIERDVSQIQATATRVFGPTFGADSLAFATEVALTRIHDMPGEDVAPLASGGAGNERADASSYGWRAAARLDYNNAFASARLSPYAQYQHDLNGSSALGGPFVEGRTAVTLGVGLGWLDRLRADLSVTLYGGSKNYLRDRDFVSFSTSYSF